MTGITCDMREVVFRQRDDVVAPGTQRRDVQLVHVKPIIKIGPETSLVTSADRSALLDDTIRACDTIACEPPSLR